MICKKCKRNINNDTRFCPWCGSKVWIQTEESKPDSQISTTTQTVQKTQTTIQTPTYEEPMSVKDWIITLLIMMIPIVNIVMLFVWAFSGKEKKSKSNYFKASLIMGGIVIAFSIVFALLIVAFGSTSDNQISQDYLEDSNALMNTYDENETDYNYDDDYYYDYDDENDDYDDYNDLGDDYELNSEYILPNSDSEKLTNELVNSLSESDISLAINEIYARHGRRFQNEDLQEYFDEKEWYNGTIDAENFDESVFNKIEKYNIRLLSKYR